MTPSRGDGRGAGRSERRADRRADRRPPFEIAGESVAPGTRKRLRLPTPRLPTGTPLDMPLTVVHGERPGPCLWISAAVHGDELNGIEIVRRVLARVADPLPRGTLLAVPVVNVFGFLGETRTLPDRRDLNRSFPGSARGSLAARIAHLFIEQIVSRCSHGIDLHTAALDRANLPQVRANLVDEATRRFALDFGGPVMVQSAERDGSLRAAASARGTVTLLFEGGEPKRFQEDVVETGVRGVLGAMHGLGLVRSRPRRRGPPTVHVVKTSWVRARRGGLLHLDVGLGQVVEERQVLGRVSAPFDDESTLLRAPFRGVVIGTQQNPVVHGGDAVVHVGRLDEGE